MGYVHTYRSSSMPDYEKLLQASMPEALDTAVESVNFVYENGEALLQADITTLEELNFCIFAYFNREELFYLNRTGRKLLAPYQSIMDRTASEVRFSLVENFEGSQDDRDVIENCRPKHHVHERVDLNWGHTCLRGSKYPIRAVNGVPIAILFAGREMLGSEQIRAANFALKSNLN